MKKLIVYFIALLLAVLGGLWMHAHPGYVLIGVAHTRIEISLWLGVFVLIVLVIAFYGLLRLLSGIFHIPRRFRAFRKRSPAQIFKPNPPSHNGRHYINKN